MADAAKVIVVGAGIGGLVSALLLSAKGLDVTLVESAPEPGGKMRALALDGVRIDAGPTVFTMRWVFDGILAQVSSSLEELVTLTPLSVLARHAWRDHGPTLDLHASLAESADAIARFSSPAEARRYLAFSEEAGRIYRTLEGPHIRSARPGFLKMVADLGPSGLARLAALGPFATLWQSLGRHFQDPRLRQLFARYATYCGGSPFAAPATLMLIAHVEAQGVWSVDGGLSTLAQRLAELAVQRGVKLRLGSTVSRIRIDKGRVSGVVVDAHQASAFADKAERGPTGEHLDADAVIFNGDINALATGLLGADVAHRVGHKPLPAQERSLSALTWVMHARTEGFALARHNVFFDKPYAGEFDDVFKQRRLPRQGTVYLCAQDRQNGVDALHNPSGAPERLLALVNAPADGDQPNAAAHRHSFEASEIQSCEHRSLALLQQCGLRLQMDNPHQQLLRRTPQDFHRLFPGSGGALYGPSPHGWMALFKRSGAATALPGLFLAGGTVHPGPGVPMAALSGQQAAETLLAHLDSTSRSRRVPTSGGTSTPSATTVNTR